MFTTRALQRAGIVALVVAIAWGLAFAVRFDGSLPAERFEQLLVTLPIVVVVQSAMLRLVGANRQSWQYTSIHDLVPVAAAIALTTTMLGLVRVASPQLPGEDAATWLAMPLGVIGIYAVIAGVGLAGARLTRRVLVERTEFRELGEQQHARRILLLGAGRAGIVVARELASRPDLGKRVIGFVDDNPVKVGRRIAGVQVLGTSRQLAELMAEHAIDEVIISIANISGADMRELVDRCEEAGARPLVVPGVSEIVAGQVSVSWFRPVEVEDLLGRDAVELDLSALDELIGGEVVVVTGAGGSIGSELARQVVRFRPKQLVLIERSEPALWAIHRELQAAHPRLDLVQAVADVGDATRIDALFARHRPGMVLHAAAHKHVPMMEDNPGEALKNNVFGTKTIVDLAATHDVPSFVLISTDKAVNPTSVMGATKRLAERYVQHVASRTGHRYVSVRFGNVLGSVGSVVPIFEEQIANGGPVTITHPDMRRYFMTIPEASQLVLQAATLGRCGEILVLDMGEPVRILELAESMITLCGKEPYTDIPIEFTGLRPGEKLFEELSLSTEQAERTRHPKIWIGGAGDNPWPDAEEDLAGLFGVADGYDPITTRNLIASFVPEFLHGGADDLALVAGPPAGR